MNNKSKINSSKGKLYLTVAAIASLLVMTFSVNTNSMNVNAIDLDNFQNFDDLGQSAECVIVVVGCDGRGSVGSSGDVNIGNGDIDNDNNTTIDPNTPLPPIDPTVCEACFVDLPTAQQQSLVIALGLTNPATLDLVCDTIDALDTVGELVVILDEAGFSAQAIVNFMACLGIDITLADVGAIIAL